MKLVKQKNGVDCGLAVAAMLANTTYGAAADADPEPDESGGVCVGDMCHLLAALTRKKWRESKVSYLKPLNLAKIPPIACAILLRQHGKSFGHWVAFDGQRIFDPERVLPLTVTEYDRRDWLVIRLLLITDQPGDDWRDELLSLA